MNFMGRCCEGFAELTGSVYGNIKGAHGVFMKPVMSLLLWMECKGRNPAMRYLSYYFSQAYEAEIEIL